MSAGFVKLYASLVHSSIWLEANHVKVAWITMLALSDAEGLVEASVGGLAKAANLSREETEDALRVLMGPDPDSRDGTTGERVEKVPGGFLVLNYRRYREKQTRTQEQTAERVRRYREKRADELDAVTLGNARKRSVRAEAEAEADTEQQKPRSRAPARAVARPGDVSEEVWQDFQKVRKAKRAPLTETAWNTIAAEAAKAGWPVERALRECITRGWAGFKADWITGSPQGRRQERGGAQVQQVRHRPELELGDPRCDCLSCKAKRRDQGAQHGN